ncbi:hypothetical protein SAMN04515671_3500 [Nakamurella panacisegetis]|uniref:Uncharacterized protein n=1 Tax=Nakamurella panacisegetis TaxID=1090615 RepID=A0A1H0RCI7_9ACTN|nr:hypothetical protein [Nakamurella panacisegetis]SDP27244.1 hypothetical protein SAMN04515671_3500 [Nakamurella panacisegetis]
MSTPPPQVTPAFGDPHFPLAAAYNAMIAERHVQEQATRPNPAVLQAELAHEAQRQYFQSLSLPPPPKSDSTLDMLRAASQGFAPHKPSGGMLPSRDLPMYRTDAGAAAGGIEIGAVVSAASSSAGEAAELAAAGAAKGVEAYMLAGLSAADATAGDALMQMARQRMVYDVGDGGDSRWQLLNELVTLYGQAAKYHLSSRDLRILNVMKGKLAHELMNTGGAG